MAFLAMVSRCVFIILFAVSSSAYPEEGQQSASETLAFENWLIELRSEAQNRGISQKVIDVALGSIVFKERVIKSDRSQAEFTETYGEYIRKRVNEWRVAKGHRYLKEHKDAIRPVSEKYAVPAYVIAAVIGIETNYGTFELTHSMFNVLATLAYDKRRGRRFRKEIFAGLEMLDKGYADLDQLKSSWAGAMGVPQFMPTTYLQFAVDFDGDGKKDIWRHNVDLYASVANYLRHYNWDSTEAWARKVRVPITAQNRFASHRKNMHAPDKHCERYRKHLFGWKNLSGWNALGIRRMNGDVLPKVDMAASLILTDEKNGHGYLVYSNFCTLMRYNPSFKYALSVGALSDALKLRE